MDGSADTSADTSADRPTSVSDLPRNATSARADFLRMRLLRFVPSLPVIPEEQPAHFRWADLVGRLLFWHDRGRWEGLSFAERVQWLALFEDS